MIPNLVQAVRFGDSTIEACAGRLVLALETIGLSQSDLATAVGFQNSSITNMVKARQFPSRDVMLHVYFRYGIDFNYMFVGDIVNLRESTVEAMIKVVELKGKE